MTPGTDPTAIASGTNAGSVVRIVARPAARARADTEVAYRDLRRMVHAGGLLDRAYRYYLWRGGSCFLFFIGSFLLPFVAPATLAWTVLAALLIGFASVQVGLIGHDAGHRAVFTKASRNWLLGQICWSLTLGISFWYWRDRHDRHHVATNNVAKDPDLRGMRLDRLPDAAGEGGRRHLSGWALAPLLIVFSSLISFSFRGQGWVYAVRSLRGRRRAVELAFLVANTAIWVAPVGLLGPRWLIVFALSQFFGGFYLGMVVAPNHKGMPAWPDGGGPTFVERQVLSSRNVTGRRLWDFLYGGLNYQIEHHLFPTMPRARLRQVQPVVKRFCHLYDLPYRDVSPLASYQAVVAAYQGSGHSRRREGHHGE